MHPDATTTVAAPTPPRRATAWINPAAVTLACATALLALGFVSLFSASANLSPTAPYTYISRQALALAAAVVAGIACWKVEMEWIRRHSWWVAGLVILGLLLTLLPGVGVMVKGSRRWLDLGPMNLQVSELAKLAVVFLLAHYLAANQGRLREFGRGFVVPLGIIGLFAGLILLQPDFGTAVLCGGVGFLLLYLAGVRWLHLLPAVALAAGAVAVKLLGNENRMQRLTAFLDVEANKSAGTYQLYQALLGFGAGGVRGVGIGNGRQQLSFLPEAHNDFIFAIVGEEMGLVFTLAVVALFAAMFAAGLVLLRRAPNLFQYLLVAGCLLLVSLQALVNLGVVTGMLPTKGMGLPFVSFGGSNLLLMGMVVGLIFNAQRSWATPPLWKAERPLREITS